MEATLIASWNPTVSSSLGCRVYIASSWKHQTLQDYISSTFYHRKPTVRHINIKPLAVGHFAKRTNATSHLKSIADGLLETTPKCLKEFPWDKAKHMVLDRLFLLAKEAIKWSFIGFFVMSSLSDAFLAIMNGRELLIPISLFIGIALADFLKESSREFFDCSAKDKTYNKHLLAVGAMFVLVKIISLSFGLQWKVLFSLIGDGGLMQVLWSARNVQQTLDVEWAYVWMSSVAVYRIILGYFYMLGDT